LDKLVRLIHPFMPFITEEIWQLISERKEGESIMISRMPESKKYNKDLVAGFEIMKEIISAVRTVRKDKEVPLKEKLELFVRTGESFNDEFLPVLIKMCSLTDVKFVTSKKEGAASFMIGTTEFYIPLGDRLDIEGELTKIQGELDYYRGFLDSVMKKLDNERFVSNAPANVIELERKKKSDAESKIKSLEERLKELEKL
jgi:valyl-tRNA synthetase